MSKVDQLTQDLAMIARNAIDEILRLKRDPDHLHTCSYYCMNYACILRQRNELRDRLTSLERKANEDVQGYGV